MFQSLAHFISAIDQQKMSMSAFNSTLMSFFCLVSFEYLHLSPDLANFPFSTKLVGKYPFPSFLPSPIHLSLPWPNSDILRTIFFWRNSQKSSCRKDR